MLCRHCAAVCDEVFVDLGFAPPSNAYLRPDDLRRSERHYPLRVLVCTTCWLVQTEDYTDASELFTHDYAYFSSTSTSWLEHARRYVDQIITRCDLGADSFVVEVASNDGYLLKNFVAAGIPCLGVEPAGGTADVAESLGIPVLREFFGAGLAQRIVNTRGHADLIVGNNVFAHVPDINDFTQGLATLLRPGGTITLEFPHLLHLIRQTQFDTIYHEHFSYLSLSAVRRIFARAGLTVYDIEELPTHGGSLRIYGCHLEDGRSPSPRVEAMFDVEAAAGLQDRRVYRDFQRRVNALKNDLVAALIQFQRDGKRVVAYGAAAKGCTLLNYAGIKPDLLALVCDAATAKQGKYLPGSHIPIVSPEIILAEKPDVILILPWNIQAEVTSLLSYVREWGGQFLVAVPEIRLW